MAAIPESTLQKLSRSEVAEIVLDKARTNQLFRVLPFVPIEGHKLTLASIDAGSSLSAFAGVEQEGGALITTVPTLASREFVLARLSAVLEVNTITQDKYSSKNNILRTLVDIKARAVRDLFCEQLYIGSGASGEFDGLKSLTLNYSQDTPAAGTVARGQLEALRAMVNVDQPAAEVYFVMHAKGYQHLNAVNYSDIEFVAHPVLGTLPSLAGVPILIDNFISTTEGVGNDETSIYCMALGRSVGLTGIVPAGASGEEIRVRGPVTSETAGKMSYHVSWDVGIGVWNKGGIARMTGVLWANTV